MAHAEPPTLGSVLVIGGCGFVGFHIVNAFLPDPCYTCVAVISRNPCSNLLPGVSYYPCDIFNRSALVPLIDKIRPTIIIHAATPSPVSFNAKIFERVNIQGTRNLLHAASAVSSVKAFIFTSSATLAAGAVHIDLDETAPLADTDPKSSLYARTKALADKLVLEANSPLEEDGTGLRTACIRLPVVYGERDQLAVPKALEALEKGQTMFQLGDGSNLWDFVSAENAAAAHVLLAKALLAAGASAPKVDGEAFNITDGERRPIWEHARTMWKAAGHEVNVEQVWVLPTPIAFAMATILEWLFWIFTLGTKQPGRLSKQQVEYLCLTHTYRIDKARERLGYVPVQSYNEGIRKAVMWSMNKNGKSGLM